MIHVGLIIFNLYSVEVEHLIKLLKFKEFWIDIVWINRFGLIVYGYQYYNLYVYFRDILNKCK